MRKAIREEILNTKQRTQWEALVSNEIESIRTCLLVRLQKSNFREWATFVVLKIECGGTLYLTL